MATHDRKVMKYSRKEMIAFARLYRKNRGDRHLLGRRMTACAWHMKKPEHGCYLRCLLDKCFGPFSEYGPLNIGRMYIVSQLPFEEMPLMLQEDPKTVRYAIAEWRLSMGT